MKLRAIMAASRPLNWVNTAFPFGLAYGLGRRAQHQKARSAGVNPVASPLYRDMTMYLGTALYAIPFNIALYGINDVFDAESDRLNARKGGIHGAVVRDEDMHGLLAVGLFSPILPALALARRAPQCTPLLVASLLSTVAYSAPPMRTKERPGFDSATAAFHVVSPALVGFAAAGGAPQHAGRAMRAFFVWSMASHALGAIQDIKADRAAGIASIATITGARTTACLAVGGYALATALLAALPSPARWIAPVSGLYIANAAAVMPLTDSNCQRATASWNRFLGLNFFTGWWISCLTFMALRRSARREKDRFKGRHCFSIRDVG